MRVSATSEMRDETCFLSLEWGPVGKIRTHADGTEKAEYYYDEKRSIIIYIFFVSVLAMTTTFSVSSVIYII